MAVVWVGSIMTPVLLPEKGRPELNIPNHFNQNLSFLLAGRLFRFGKCRVVVYGMCKIFTENIRKDEPILINIFQTGWNHQQAVDELFSKWFAVKKQNSLNSLDLWGMSYLILHTDEN